MQPLSETDEEESVQDKRLPLPPPRPRLLDEEPARPQYRAEKSADITAAERGVATHKVLSLLRLDASVLEDTTHIPAYVEKDIQRLVKGGLLSQSEWESAYPFQIEQFLVSSLGKRMLRSADVRREWSFNVRFPALCEAVVQGVIDLCFIEDGQWVLVDYKTDYIPSVAELLERYRAQISLYRQALREITGIAVKEAWLFSLRLCEGVTVPEGDVSRGTC